MKKILQRWWRRRQLSKLKQRHSRLWTVLRWGLRILLLILVADFAYVMLIWPDWSAFKSGQTPKSRFIRDYEEQTQAQLFLPGLQWEPISYNWIPPHLGRAVIAAEDARFYYHNGFDVIAFKEAMDVNLELKQLKYGASTISQQTVKNLFFTRSRNPLRKWHELLLTLGMEYNLSKQQILATYLNIAEFGRGIYGIQAASQHYYGVPAYSLTQHQAAELAATLPSPIKHNPGTRSKRFLKRAQRIYYWMQLQTQEKE